MKKISFILVTLCFSAAAYAQQPAYIAGLAPDQRPAGAPRITSFQKPADWDTRVFKGISRPYPDSIMPQAMEQGGWYTPFNRKGMPGPYDIRSLHSTKKAKKI